jgi:hypothetical protein
VVEESTENQKKPMGRPPGSRNKSKGAALLERLVSSNKREIQEIFEQTLKLAKAGEPCRGPCRPYWIGRGSNRSPARSRSNCLRSLMPRTAKPPLPILADCGAGKLTPDEAKSRSKNLLSRMSRL